MSMDTKRTPKAALAALKELKAEDQSGLGRWQRLLATAKRTYLWTAAWAELEAALAELKRLKELEAELETELNAWIAAATTPLSAALNGVKAELEEAIAAKSEAKTQLIAGLKRACEVQTQCNALLEAVYEVKAELEEARRVGVEAKALLETAANGLTEFEAVKAELVATRAVGVEAKAQFEKVLADALSKALSELKPALWMLAPYEVALGVVAEAIVEARAKWEVERLTRFKDKAELKAAQAELAELAAELEAWIAAHAPPEYKPAVSAGAKAQLKASDEEAS